MPKKENTIVNSILDFLNMAGNILPLPFETPYAHTKRLRQLKYKGYYDSTYRMSKRGIVRLSTKNGQKFIEITKRGQLEILLAKARMVKPMNWDGKWRILIFDIPEETKKLRNHLRALLKRNGFKKLQASVFINPHPLNKEAIEYLKETNLIDYIRIIRADKIDDDADLRRRFKL